MGKLEDIVERNKHPRRHRRKGVTMGLLVAMFVFLILVLMIFTDLDESPMKPAPTPAPSGEKRVDGVLLYRDKPAARDAGAASGSN